MALDSSRGFAPGYSPFAAALPGSRPAASLVAAVFFCLALFELPLPARAADSGGQPGAFLFYGVGGRAEAMGGAYTSISNDASAAYYNPAGLARLQRKELSLMQATLSSTAKFNYFSLAWPTKKGSTYALSITQLSAAGFEQVDVKFDPATGLPTSVTSGGSFSSSEQSMAFSWGKGITEDLAFGMTLKQVTRALGGVSDTNQTLDVGILKSVNASYSIGLAIQNVFSQVKGQTSDKLPVVVKAGNSFRFFKDRLTVALDANKPVTGSMDMRFGGEYWIARWFAFRFGLVGASSVQETDFGFGFKFNSFAVDIAESIHDLGLSTRMGFTLRFGQSKEDQSGVQVKAFIKQGFEAFQEGNFTLAALKFNQALDAQPGNIQVKTLLARLNLVTTFVPQAVGGEEFQTHVRKGVSVYVDGRDLRGAVNALRYAFNKNPKDEKLLALLNMVEKEAGSSDVTRRIDGPEQFTWIDQKIYDARQSVYDGKYDAAVRRAQDVLDLEPNNVTALEIMGSAFYMMEQKDKALAVWRRVLEIDPSNQAVKEFLQRIK